MIVPPLPVAISVAGHEIRGWTSYTITPSGPLEPTGSAELSMPFDRAAWDLVEHEERFQVVLGGVVVLTGFLEEAVADDDDTIMIRGRSLIGRLVQESAPTFRFEGQTMQQLFARLASPWFSTVTLSNERNRRVLRGKGRKAAAAAEPLRVSPRPGGALAEPGQPRFALMEEIARQARCMFWSSGDGRELIIGRPNYAQAPQWRLFRPAAGSDRGAESTVLSMRVQRSTADRYTRVIVTGSGRGTSSSYGPAVAARYGQALDAGGAEGVGGDFREPKRLVVHEPVHSVAEATDIAKHELARRAARGTVIACTAPGHGQVILPGLPPTIFCADTLAHVEDERTGTVGSFWVSGITFKSTRQAGETTDLELVRAGVELGL